MGIGKVIGNIGVGLFENMWYVEFVVDNLVIIILGRWWCGCGSC